MPATATGRGAQVVTDPDSDTAKAIRGAYATTFEGNAAKLANDIAAGVFADGFRPDGTTRSGAAAFDFVVDNTIGSSVAGVITALSLGFVGDGTTDNTAAITKLFSLTNNESVYFPPGVYNMGSPSAQTDAASNISIEGAGRSKTILQFNADVALPSAMNVYRWFQRSGFSLRNFTLDLNSATAAGHTNVVFLRNCTRFVVDNVGIVGGTDNMNLLSVSADTGATTSHYWITNCYISMNSPAPPIWNAGIIMNANNGAGTMLLGHVQNNIVINTNIRIDGAHNIVTGNDVSGTCGPTIWTTPTWLNAGSGHNVIANNHFHDTDLRINGDGVPAGGIEWDSSYDLVANNLIERCGGPGIIMFASYGNAIGNIITDCGRATTPRGVYDQAGVRVPATYGGNCRLIGNVARDTGGGTQLYGYYEEDGAVAAGIELRGNVFSGATAPMYSPHAVTTVEAPKGAIATGAGLSPAATSSTTAVMAGLGVQITPVNSGVIDVWMTGACRNNTASDGLTLQIRYGTGTPPANGAATTGTAVGTGLQAVNGTGAMPTMPFTLLGTITGLVRGTTYWLDISFRALTGGTVSATAIDVRASER